MYILHTFKNGQRDIYMLGVGIKRDKKFRDASNSFFKDPDAAESMDGVKTTYSMSPDVICEENLHDTHAFEERYKITQQVSVYAELMYLDDSNIVLDDTCGDVENISVSSVAFWLQNEDGLWTTIEPRVDFIDRTYRTQVVAGNVSVAQIRETLNNLEV